MKSVILIDAGTGNLRSVQKAFEYVGADVQRTDDVKKITSGGRVVLPGVGAFGDFMFGLQAKGLDEAVLEIARKDIPLFGICVGMQALFELSEELGEHKGLGILTGTVKAFPKMPEVKIPHTGWNQLAVKQGAQLFDQIEDEAYVYFNHSYFCQPQKSTDMLAETNYGINFVSAVQSGNVFGVQFHPEKSQAVGLQILKNFLELT